MCLTLSFTWTHFRRVSGGTNPSVEWRTSHLKRAMCVSWVERVAHMYERWLWDSKQVVNSGLLYGSILPLYQLVCVFTRLEYWCRNDEHDQAIPNYLFYKGFLPQGFELADMSLMISVTSWQFSKHCSGDGLIRTVEEAFPATLHQYDRARPLLRFLCILCPPLGHWHDRPFRDDRPMRHEFYQKYWIFPKWFLLFDRIWKMFDFVEPSQYFPPLNLKSHSPSIFWGVVYWLFTCIDYGLNDG
jgi:hypothetical protein